MMKSRTLFFIAIGLLILGIALFTFSRSHQESTQVFPATVVRDCAPWDGAAFTVSVQYDASATIYISIWQSPDFNFPATFSFPDETGQIGIVYILPELGPYTELRGEVSLESVGEGMPLEGRFNFTSERGGQFKGQFKAEWRNEIVYCG